MKTDLIIISYGLIYKIGTFSFFILEPGEKEQRGRGGREIDGRE